MANLRFRCPHCSRKIEVDERGAGLEAPCPECHRTIEIPTQEEAQRLAERHKMDTQPIAALPTMKISLSGRKRIPRYRLVLGVLILVCALCLLAALFSGVIPLWGR
jgi:phage FluMu protein Com